MDSKLQIISGMFRGRKLRLPASARPTQNRARIALFNMLESLGVTPSVAWDAFAGSGAFGLEILSLYPTARVVFSDTAADTIKIIRDNLKNLNIDSRATALCGDALDMISKYGTAADLIFLDPPYANAADARDFVTRLTNVACAGTILVWEQDASAATNPPAGWAVLRDRQYGRARFLILRRDGE